MPNFKFDLGDEVKDSITGFKGIINCRSQWLNQCNTYGIKSQSLKDGKPMDSVHFDEPQIVLVKAGAHKAKRSTGGPTKVVPETNRLQYPPAALRGRHLFRSTI